MLAAAPFWRLCRDYGGAAGVGGYLAVEARLRLLAPKDGRRALLVGSSITREDLDEELIAAGVPGWEAVNLGFDSGQPVDLLAAERRLLRAEPDALVYLPHINSFFGDYGDGKPRYWFSPRMAALLAARLPPSLLWSRRSELIRGALGSASFLYRYNRQIASFLEEEAFAAKAAWVSGGPLRRPVLPRFAYDHDEPPSYFAGALERCRDEGFLTERYYAVNREAFTAFARAARASGARLIVVDAPMHPLAERCLSREARERYAALLSELSRETGAELISGAALPRLDAGHFVDLFHLNARGRAVLSRFVARELERRP